MQEKMAQYCTEIFGDLLLSSPLEENPLDPGVAMPNAVKLRKKIVIKNKRMPFEEETKQLELWKLGGKSVLGNGSVYGNTQHSVLGSAVGTVIPPKLERDQSERSLIPDSDENDRTKNTTVLQNRELSPKIIKNLEADFIKNLKSSSNIPNNTLQSQISTMTTSDTYVTPTVNPELDAAMKDYQRQGTSVNLHPSLSSLVNYCQSVPFKGFQQAEKNDKHYHMSSFSETAGLGYLRHAALDFVKYNARQNSRIYPKGERISSNNYVPQLFWNVGCQMVALNYQTNDIPMQLNYSKFEYNNNSGYLLKPKYMRDGNSSFDPFSESPMDGVIAAQLNLKILSGQNLHDKPATTYVEVDVYGLPTDTIRKEHRTKLVNSNSLNPVYAGSENTTENAGQSINLPPKTGLGGLEEINNNPTNNNEFHIRKIIVPDLALVRFMVYEQKEAGGKQLLGQRTIPFKYLQNGYRHIMLRTVGNKTIGLPSIFVKIDLKTYVPDDMMSIVDMLQNPRSHLTAVQKRTNALKEMGCVDEEDLENKEDLFLDAVSSVKKAIMPKNVKNSQQIGQKFGNHVTCAEYSGQNDSKLKPGGGANGGAFSNSSSFKSGNLIPGISINGQDLTQSDIQLNGGAESSNEPKKLLQKLTFSDFKKTEEYLTLVKNLSRGHLRLMQTHYSNRQNLLKRTQTQLDDLYMTYLAHQRRINQPTVLDRILGMKCCIAMMPCFHYSAFWIEMEN